MSKKALPPEMSELLKGTHFAYFCTTDRANQVHVAPMFFLFDDKTNEVFVFSFSGSKKIKNIRANPKVCLTVDVRDPENPFENRGVMVQGRATIEKGDEKPSANQDYTLEQIYERFNEKYPVLREEPIGQREYQEFRDVLVKVTADKMVYWKGPHFISVSL